MNETNNVHRRVSRRAVLTNSALAFGAAAAGATVVSAQAQQKLTQAAAKYQDHPKGSQSCAICANFQPPNACRFVAGTISPNGWCQLFAPKS
jgi:hypothetical protein